MSKEKLSDIDILDEEKRISLDKKIDKIMNSHIEEFEKVEKIYLTNATREELMKYVKEYNYIFKKCFDNVKEKLEGLIKENDLTGAEELTKKAIIQNREYLNADEDFLYRHANQDKDPKEAIAYFLIKMSGDELLPLLKE